MTLTCEQILSLTDGQNRSSRCGTDSAQDSGDLGQGGVRKEWKAEFHLNLKFFISLKN